MSGTSKPAGNGGVEQAQQGLWEEVGGSGVQLQVVPHGFTMLPQPGTTGSLRPGMG
jgi:hypothetical protein